jgi:hypothetical protein
MSHSNIQLKVTNTSSSERRNVVLFNAIDAAFEEVNHPDIQIESFIPDVPYKKILRELAGLETNILYYTIGATAVFLQTGDWPEIPLKDLPEDVEVYNFGFSGILKQADIDGSLITVPFIVPVDKQQLQRSIVMNDFPFKLHNKTSLEFEMPPGQELHFRFFFLEKITFSRNFNSLSVDGFEAKTEVFDAVQNLKLKKCDCCGQFYIPD